MTTETNASKLLEGPIGRAALCSFIGISPDDVSSILPSFGGLGGMSTRAAERVGAGLSDLKAAVRDEPESDELGLTAELGRFISEYAFGAFSVQWQNVAHEVELLASALSPVAYYLASLPQIDWWWAAMDRAHQRYLLDVPADQTESPATAIRDARDQWWTEPISDSLPRTTRGPVSGVPAASVAISDGHIAYLGSHLTVQEASVAPETRVYEVAGPEDWIALVEAYGVETGPKSHWATWTKWDGPWIVPDFELVSRDFDAVHVSVAGCLGAAYRALPLGTSGRYTMLAGWNPDEALWLNGGPVPGKEIVRVQNPQS